MPVGSISNVIPKETLIFAPHDRQPEFAPAKVHSRWPCYADDEIAAVVEVLRSGRVNALQHGDNCRAFEDAFAALCDMPFAISLANGTVALELALRALGIRPGDEVVVTPRSFVASADPEEHTSELQSLMRISYAVFCLKKK